MKRLALIVTAILILGSCGFSAYKLEPSFLRYPFEKLLDYEFDNRYSGYELLVIPKPTLDSGALMYEYFPDNSTSYYGGFSLYEWEAGTFSLVSPSVGNIKPVAFSIPDTDAYVQIVESPSLTDQISVFEIDSGFNQLQLAFLEIDFNTDFTIPFGISEYSMENHLFSGGRLYFTNKTETEITELSYRISTTVVDNPDRTWPAFIQLDKLYTDFFSTIQTGDTFWQEPDVRLEAYHHYPSLNSGTSVVLVSQSIEFTSESDIKFLVIYDGVDLSGLQVPATIYNALFLPGGYLLTEERDPDLSADIVRLYDCTGSQPAEMTTLTFQANELEAVGTGSYLGEAVILWTPYFEDLYRREKAAIYSLPLSYLLEAAQ